MEQRLGGDFGSVRLRADTDAAASAAALGVRAYAAGNHVVLGADEYRPGTHGYRRLLAHELAHIRQMGGPTSPRELPSASWTSAFWQETTSSLGPSSRAGTIGRPLNRRYPARGVAF
jgi:hypothetical protein